MLDPREAAIHRGQNQLLRVDDPDAQIGAKPMFVVGGKDDELTGSDGDRLLIRHLEKHAALRHILMGNHMCWKGHVEEPDLFGPDCGSGDAPGRAELTVEEDAA
jgi:hypothetical protein